MSGSVSKRLLSAHTYDALVMLAATSDNSEITDHLTQIDKDLLRTFPGALYSICLASCFISYMPGWDEPNVCAEQRIRYFARAGRRC